MIPNRNVVTLGGLGYHEFRANLDQWDVTYHAASGFLCADCGAEAEGYMLLDEVWLSVAASDEILCLACTERRLERPLTAEDFDCDGICVPFSIAFPEGETT